MARGDSRKVRRPGRIRWLVACGAFLTLPTAVRAQSEIAPLYNKFCAKCHGADGTGKPGRVIEPAIPDFTSDAWHKKRSDAQLLTSILDGKGTTMPTFRGKVKDKQARGLINHIRAFAPTKPDARRSKDADAQTFEREFRSLQEQLFDLQQQFRALSVGHREHVQQIRKRDMVEGDEN